MEKKITRLEIKLAAYIACHSTVNSIYHLSDLLNKDVLNISSDSIKLHRTKCICFITKVIAPCLIKKLVSDIKNSPFPPIIDESTDIACIKHLCICIHYHSTSHNSITTKFLGLIPVTSTTVLALY